MVVFHCPGTPAQALPGAGGGSPWSGAAISSMAPEFTPATPGSRSSSFTAVVEAMELEDLRAALKKKDERIRALEERLRLQAAISVGLSWDFVTDFEHMCAADRALAIKNTVTGWRKDLGPDLQLLAHYTSVEAAEQIGRAGFKMSPMGLAGGGVYFSTILPGDEVESVTWPHLQWREAMLRLNYADGHASAERASRMDAVVLVSLWREAESVPKRPGAVVVHPVNLGLQGVGSVGTRYVLRENIRHIIVLYNPAPTPELHVDTPIVPNPFGPQELSRQPSPVDDPWVEGLIDSVLDQYTKKEPRDLLLRLVELLEAEDTHGWEAAATALKRLMELLSLPDLPNVIREGGALAALERRAGLCPACVAALEAIKNHGSDLGFAGKR